MSRKETLRAMLGQRAELPAGNQPPTPAHVRSGAVGAMSRTLGKIASATDNARALIAAGDAVVEIPTAKLSGSFVSDRFEAAGDDHTALVESIREHGQQVPILVRPHPEKPGAYQIAYGHRRVRALVELERPARAVVRELSDEDLVVAQGQENSARTDLSYIERARFAMALLDRKFDRGIIMAALNMEKTQLSRLLAIGRAIPAKVADAIGPAPKAGRPRWAALAEAFEKGDSTVAEQAIANPKFLAADSDARFARVLSAMTAKPRHKPEIFTSEGQKLVTVKRGGDRIALTALPEFGEFIAEQLPELYRAFQAQKEDKAD